MNLGFLSQKRMSGFDVVYQGQEEEILCCCSSTRRWLTQGDSQMKGEDIYSFVPGSLIAPALFKWIVLSNIWLLRSEALRIQTLPTTTAMLYNLHQGPKKWFGFQFSLLHCPSAVHHLFSSYTQLFKGTNTPCEHWEHSTGCQPGPGQVCQKQGWNNGLWIEWMGVGKQAEPLLLYSVNDWCPLKH